MRTLIYVDTDESKKSDREFRDYLIEELPGRLKLLEADYGNIPWSATFAHEEFGVESLDELAATLRRDGDGFDAVLVVPNADLVEHDARNHPYFKKLRDIVDNAGDMPLVAYVDTPGPKVEFNLLSAGFATVVDQTNEPALLPLKIARAVNRNVGASAVLSMGPLTIDLGTGEVAANGARIPLTPHERSVLTYLARARGKVRTKEQILKSMYGLDEEEPEIKIIDVFMTKVRGKINARVPGLGFDLLRTSWGDGYYMLKDMPENRVHRGMLRLDPLEGGGYAVADTALTITDAQFEMFEYLHDRMSRPLSQKDNFLMSNQETLDTLNSILSGYLVARGPALMVDPEDERISLNPDYFDPEVFDASTFSMQLRQEVKVVGPHQFLRVNNANSYMLTGTEIAFSTAELRLLEQLVQVEGQAVRGHSLYRQVRGESHPVRGDKSPDEDIVELARALYRKLEQAGETDTNIHIYHDTYVSYGAAEEVPDPETTRAETKERVQGLMRERLARASGTEVTLDRHDFGHFAVLVHPTLKTGMIEGHTVDLRPYQVAILTAAHAARTEEGPAIVSHRDMFERVYPARPYVQQKISQDVVKLRSILTGINPEWAHALAVIHGHGYASLMPGEAAPTPKTVKQDLPQRVINWDVHPLDGFTLKVDPETGGGVIDERNQDLTPPQVKILRALHTHREQLDTAAPLSSADLYRQVFGDGNFVPAQLTHAVNQLRSILNFHATEWGEKLRTLRGRGFAWLRDGDVIEEEAPAPRAAPAQRRAAEPAETPEEVELTGGLVLLRSPSTGAAKVQGADFALSTQETELFTLLAEQYPRGLFVDELQRRLKIANVKGMAERVEKRWAIHCPDVVLPFSRHGASAYVWALTPLRHSAALAAETPAAEPATDFDLQEGEGGMLKCGNLKITFTPREAELLIVLEQNRGSTLALNAVEQGSRFKWTEPLILQTLTAAQAKIARARPDIATRMSFSAKKKCMQLGVPQSRLPTARPSVA